MSKILTVSISAYNVEKYIEKTLDSLIDDSIIDDLEIFIIDDGGTDNTLRIAQEFADKYPDSVFPIHKENGGYGSTINTAIELATGKYFKQLDGDDWFDKNYFKMFVNLLKNISADCVLTYFIRYYEKKSKIEYETMYDYIKEGEYSLEESGINDRFTMYTTTYLTKILKEGGIHLTEHCFYTDIEYSALPLPFINTIYVLHIPVYVYRIGEDGQSMNIQNIKKHYKEHDYVFWKLVKIYNGIPNNRVVQRKIFLYILRGRLIEHFKFLCLLPISSTSLNELIMYKKVVEKECPEVFKMAVDHSRAVYFLIKSHFLTYPFIRVWLKHKWMS